MKKLTYILPIFLLISCAHQKKSLTQSEILNHCQDLNVLYTRINLIENNIVNIKTTRSLEGGPYKRKYVKSCTNGICEVAVDEAVPLLKYEPKHPDANKEGYVAYPNFRLADEEYDRSQWSRVFEAVFLNAPVPKNFFFNDSRANECFEKYPLVKANLDYSEYLGRETNIY